MKAIYLDNAATTKVDSEVYKNMKPYFEIEYGNPSSIYELGLNAKAAIRNSRQKIAAIIGSNSEEIIFTGSGTESDNLAIFGIARASKNIGNHIISSPIEHPAVLECLKKLETEGFEISYLKVDSSGFVNPEDLAREIKDSTILVSIMFGNNEIGTIEPIEQIGQKLEEINKERMKNNMGRIYFHTDACQAAGFIKLNVNKLKIDAMTINGSKIYGPKGIGFLYIRNNTPIEPIIYGGKQENGIRSGTENVAGIVGLAKAFEIAQENSKKYFDQIYELKKYFIDCVKKRIDRIILNSDFENCLPSILSISFLDIEGESALLLLDQKGIYCSTGSACTAKSLKPSHALKAIGLKDEIIHGTLRFSFGKYNSKEEIDYVISELAIVVDNLRKISPIHIN
ncbi:MAG: cysteine desulfurase family protein [Patescibacteria group bacterium]|jgi:cysteine desulfurase